MGKNSAGSPGSRSEPYNQPIKIYNVMMERCNSPSERLMGESAVGCATGRLGRTIDARINCTGRIPGVGAQASASRSSHDE